MVLSICSNNIAPSAAEWLTNQLLQLLSELYTEVTCLIPGVSHKFRIVRITIPAH